MSAKGDSTIQADIDAAEQSLQAMRVSSDPNASVGNSEAAAASTSGQTYSPEQMLEALQAIPEKAHTFSTQKLLSNLTLQRTFLVALAGLAGAPQESVSLRQLDILLSTFLKQVYCLIVALPGGLHLDALETIVLKAHLLGTSLAAPFLGALHADGELEIGIPENQNAKCDTISELVRLASAAVLTYFHYTNCPGNTRYSSADDATLLFTSMVIASCADAESSALLKKGLEEVGEPITLTEIRWLMYYLRAQLWGLYGSIHFVTGNPTKHKDFLLQQQADFLALIRAQPENPAGYLYYSRSCLQFQQHRMAALFSGKGIAAAAKSTARFYTAALSSVRGVALALGGGGDAAALASAPAAAASAEASSSRDSAAEGSQAAGADSTVAAADAAAAAAAPRPLFRVGEVRQLLADAQSALAEERAVLPPMYQQLTSLEPDLDILRDKVVGPLNGTADDSSVPSLGLMYTIRPPRGVPRGAVPNNAQAAAAAAATGGATGRQGSAKATSAGKSKGKR